MSLALMESMTNARYRTVGKIANTIRTEVRPNTINITSFTSAMQPILKTAARSNLKNDMERVKLEINEGQLMGMLTVTALTIWS